MRERMVWSGAAVDMLTGICHRGMGLTLGKAIAFIYAVIVSVVANVVFDFVRYPPHSEATEPIAVATTSADSAAARVLLPAPPAIAAVSATPITAALPAAPTPADNPRPGPGSGGLY